MTERWSIHHGDVLDRLPELAPESFDAVLCDPPYLLKFMGKDWDAHQLPCAPDFGSWLAGFADGEGCFLVKEAHGGQSVSCSFQIKVRRDDKTTLETIRKVLGIGSVSDVDGDGKSKPQAIWRVQSKEDCKKLVRVFSVYPLRAKKSRDFAVWAEAVMVWLGQKRGNRWTGPTDKTEIRKLRDELMGGREYDAARPVNPDELWHYLWARGVYRALKPGAHLLAFGGTRTEHRLVCAIEDAGFEIRDKVMYLYGVGFPKSHNLDGAFKGYGTALKPAYEPCVVAMKPLDGTFAANAAAHGVAGLNIDGGRIGTEGETIPRITGKATLGGTGDGWDRPWKNDPDAVSRRQERADAAIEKANNLGRWPANLILDAEAAAMLGAPARYYYTAKASTRERNAGLEDLPSKTPRDLGMGDNAVGAGRGSRSGPRKNHHPTLKPIDLCRYLATLILPPRRDTPRRLLVPFSGSGSEMIGALLAGWDEVVGIEREREYIEIAERRLAHWCASSEEDADTTLFAESA